MSDQIMAVASWQVASLGDLFEIKDRERIPVNAYERAARPGSVPYYGATGQVGWIDDFIFNEELILLGEDGAPFLQGDKPKAYVIRGKTWVNNHAHVLRALATSPSAFWKYQLDRVDFHGFVSGTTRLKLPQGPMRQVPLLVPPLCEQHRIVEAIESYFTRLDDAVATLERVQRNLKRYRASVLKAAVEGRLVPTEAELARAEGHTYEPASVLLVRILAERRRRWEVSELAKMKVKDKVPKDETWKGKYAEPVVPYTSDLPGLPEGWCWASVDQLAAHKGSSLTDGPFGSHLKSSHYTLSGPRVVRLQNIGDGVFLNSEAHVSPEHFASLHKHSVDPGDVVIASLGTALPRACVIPDWLGPAIVKADCLRFAPHPELMQAWFAAYALNAPPSRKRAEDLVHGVGRPRIGLTLLRQFPLPLPPLAEQTRILEAVGRLLSLGDESTVAASQNAVRCGMLRQSILKWAFEGRLVDQDPTDEPASALLERIKAERLSEHTALAASDTKKPKSPGRRKARTSNA